jgi:membrane protein implicated in regulation of membrane protease activity
MEISTSLLWILAGVLLILSELVATSVVAVFLGLGAIATGIAMELGVISTQSAQYITFSTVSIVTLLTARSRLKRWFQGQQSNDASHGQEVSQHIGQMATVVDDFQQCVGRVRLNGVQWDARTVDNVTLKQGQHVRIIENEGLTLIVRPLA